MFVCFLFQYCSVDGTLPCTPLSCSHCHLSLSVSACLSLHSGVVCGEVLPAVVGLVWALRSTPQDRIEKLRTIFSLSYEDTGQLQLSFKEFIRLRGHRLVNIPQEGEKKESKDDFLSPFAQRVNFDEKCVMTLYHTVGARMGVVCYRVSLCVILDVARCHRQPGSWMHSCYRTWKRKWPSTTRCGWVGCPSSTCMCFCLCCTHTSMHARLVATGRCILGALTVHDHWAALLLPLPLYPFLPSHSPPPSPLQSSPVMPCSYRGVTYFLQYVYFSALQQMVVNSELGEHSPLLHAQPLRYRQIDIKKFCSRINHKLMAGSFVQ